MGFQSWPNVSAESAAVGLGNGRSRVWTRLQGMKPGLFFSIRVRLVLWYIAILALVLIIFSAAIYAAEQHALLSEIDGRVHARLQQLAGAYDARSGRLTTAPDAETVRGGEVVLILTPNGRLTQIQAAGRLSAVKMPLDQALKMLSAMALRSNSAVVDQGLVLTVPAGMSKDGALQITTPSAAIFRVSGMPLIVRHRVSALLVVAIRSDVAQQMSTLARTLEIVAPLILVLCAGGGYWLADRALRPIRTITRTAQQIGATDLRRRLNLRRRDELGQLATTFDTMLDRLEAAFERQRQFTADASHELRTPLTIIDLEATRALARPRAPEEYRRAINVMQQENDHMTRLINDLLALARADIDHNTMHRGNVDLSEIVLDVAERLESLAQLSCMTIRIDPLPELLV
ncbi:MAG: hypothetical protein JWO59_389, partial [Chloroflexi bacterium]|nr:hypothetical protein [Chloroflexota bacterium]